MDESILASILKKEYGIHVKDVTFIPWGTSAYSYKVNSVDGECYYLKLLDTANNKQRRATKRLDWYLPMTWNMYHKGIFRNLTYPIRTKDGRYYSSFDKAILILFTFIEGETAKNSSSWKATLEKIAKLVAKLHKATPVIEKNKIRKERFDTGPQPSLLRTLSVLESTAAFDNPYKEALQGLILPKKDHLLHFMDVFSSLQSTVDAIQKERVLCHGDLWAGNIIIHQNEVFFIDWESAVIAPPERDLSNYCGYGFEIFLKQYEAHIEKKVILHSDLLRFYLYRRRLTHLKHLIMNILFRNTTEAENKIDLDMISNYYTDTLDRIEPAIHKAQSLLKNNII